MARGISLAGLPAPADTRTADEQLAEALAENPPQWLRDLVARLVRQELEIATAQPAPLYSAPSPYHQDALHGDAAPHYDVHGDIAHSDVGPWGALSGSTSHSDIAHTDSHADVPAGGWGSH